MYCEVRIQNSSPIFTFRCPSRCPFVTMISPLDLGVKSRKRWDYYQCAPISQFATFALVVWFPRSLGNQSPGTQALISNQKSRHRVIITTRELFYLSTRQANKKRCKSNLHENTIFQQEDRATTQMPERSSPREKTYLKTPGSSSECLALINSLSRIFFYKFSV